MRSVHRVTLLRLGRVNTLLVVIFLAGCVLGAVVLLNKNGGDSAVVPEVDTRNTAEGKAASLRSPNEQALDVEMGLAPAPVRTPVPEPSDEERWRKKYDGFRGEAINYTIQNLKKEMHASAEVIFTQMFEAGVYETVIEPKGEAAHQVNQFPDGSPRFTSTRGITRGDVVEYQLVSLSPYEYPELELMLKEINWLEDQQRQQNQK